MVFRLLHPPSSQDLLVVKRNLAKLCDALGCDVFDAPPPLPKDKTTSRKSRATVMEKSGSGLESGGSGSDETKQNDNNNKNGAKLLKKNSMSDDEKKDNGKSPQDELAAKERGQYFKKPTNGDMGSGDLGGRAPPPGAHTYSIDHMEASIRETIMQCFGRGMGDVAREIRNLTRQDQEKFTEMERSVVRLEQSLSGLKDKLQVRKKSEVSSRKDREGYAPDDMGNRA